MIRLAQLAAVASPPWFEAIPALDDEMWWHYQEHGYLHLRGFFGDERFHLIDHARDHLDALWAGTANSETQVSILGLEPWTSL